MPDTIPDITTNTSKTNGILVLVRHGQSLWNAKGLWTGWTDISLSEEGKREAQEAGLQLAAIHFDLGYTSVLVRAKQTMDEIQNTLHQSFPIIETEKLNERNYGVFTGKNKWEIEKSLGEETFAKLRRSWDFPIENGESLKDVYARVIPYYKGEILPKLEQGKHILIAAHGNSLRALIKYLDAISDEDISHLEMATGETYVYTIAKDGSVLDKKILNTKGGTVS